MNRVGCGMCGQIWEMSTASYQHGSYTLKVADSTATTLTPMCNTE